MADSETTTATGTPRVGTMVEVKARFDGTWASGFEVAELEDDGYRIRRMTDGSVLPSVFRPNEIRRASGHSNWRARKHHKHRQ